MAGLWGIWAEKGFDPTTNGPGILLSGNGFKRGDILSLRICISKKFPGGADATGLGGSLL